MGNCGINLATGLQRLLDSQQSFVRNAHAVYLRVRNFAETPTENALYAQLGRSITPASGETGTTDILITPTPAVRMISQHNIGQSQGKLRFGARYFLISATWVASQNPGVSQSALEAYWRGPQIVGLVLDNQLFSIEEDAHEEIGGVTVLWTLSCNAVELSGGNP